MKLLRYYISTTFIVLLASLCSYGQDANYVLAYGKLKVEWGNTDNTLITLYEDDKEIDTYRPQKNGKFQFSLELNHVYMFWFEKPGHVTKKVQFDTHVPEAVTTDPDFIPFPDFDFNVILFKSYPEVDTMFFVNPVGKIKYYAKPNDFDYDKNYTLEIIKRMQEIEDNIRQKHENEEKNKNKKPPKAKNNEPTNDIAEAEPEKTINKKPQPAESEVAIKQEKIPETVQQKNEETSEKKQVKPKSETINTAQAENGIANKNKGTEKAAPPEQNQVPKAKVEPNKPKPNKAEPETGISKAAKSGNNRQAHKIVKPKATSTSVNNTEVAGKKTTRTSVTKNGVTLIYIKVEYKWGGRYFFIQDESNAFRNISENYYNIMVSGKK